MEPRGCNRWQSAASHAVARTAEIRRNRCRELRPIAFRYMVTRGRLGSPRAANRQQTSEIASAQPCGAILWSDRGTAWIKRSRSERRRRCDGRSGLSRRRSRVRVPSLPLKYLHISVFCCPTERDRPPASQILHRSRAGLAAGSRLNGSRRPADVVTILRGSRVRIGFGW